MLRLPVYRAYLATRFLLILSLNLQFTVVSYLIYTLTRYSAKGAPWYLGQMGLAEVIPAIGASIFSGHLIDRVDKSRAVRVCVAAYFVLSFFVALPGAAGMRSAMGGTPSVLALLYLTVFIGGAIRSFWSPSAFSLVGQIVPRHLIPNAATWSSMAWQTGAVAGPLLGGLLLSATDFLTPLILCSALQGAALICSFRLPRAPAQPRRAEPVLQSLAQGLRFVFRTEVVLAALSLDLFAVLFGGATALLPVFAEEILHVGKTGYGWLKAATGIGSVITLTILSMLPLRTHPGRKLAFSIVGFGLCTVVFGFSTSFLLSLGMLILIGLFDGLSVVIRSTILQLRTPEAMKGRVAAVNTMFVSSSNEIGAMESGFAARHFDTVPAVVGGGVIVLMVMGITWLASPGLRRLDLTAEKEENAEDAQPHKQV